MIEIQNLTKIYQKTNKSALLNVDLNIKKGEFTALLGQNGAGKSTLINILAGNVVKTEGCVRIGGYDIDKHALQTKRVLGIVPQEVAIDFSFTVEEILKKQSGYFGIAKNEAYIDYLLESFALQDKKKAKGRALSGGMKRRLLIVKALVHKPQILILDEPTAGVDIELRHSMYQILEKLHQEGMTLVLTTHYIEEAEKLCKRILVINDGKIIADQPKHKLLKDFSREIELEISFEQSVSRESVDFLEVYQPKFHEGGIVLKMQKDDLNSVLQQCIDRKLKINDLTVNKQKLEDIYLRLIKR